MFHDTHAIALGFLYDQFGKPKGELALYNS